MSEIGILLLEDFNSLAMQAFVDPFRCANYLKGESLYKWNYLSFGAEKVTASNGLSVCDVIDVQQNDISADMFVINTSWSPERFYSAQMTSWLRKQSARKKILCGLDTGAFLLANAGLLKGHRAAVHYEHIAAFRELFPNVTMGEDLYVLEDNLYTCCGGMACSDMALEIIRQEHGEELANAAGRYLFHIRLREGKEGQLPSGFEPLGARIPKSVKDAILLMESNLEFSLSISEIANKLKMSQRQLERLFKRYTGLSPVRYYVDVRLDRARSLITQTELSIISVGVACGFSSAAQFSRSYRQRFGLSPSKDRTEGRIPFQFRSFPSHAGLSKGTNK